MESLSAWAIGLPNELKAAIAVAVLYAVRLALAGRVPDQWLMELAAAITTALITVIELALGLVPPEFEAVAVAILNLIAVLIGSILVVNIWRILKAAARESGLRF
jgi:hypothetical protein